MDCVNFFIHPVDNTTALKVFLSVDFIIDLLHNYIASMMNVRNTDLKNKKYFMTRIPYRHVKRPLTITQN